MNSWLDNKQPYRHDALSRGKRDNIPKPQNEITSVVPLNGGGGGWNGRVVLGLCSFSFFRGDCALLVGWLVAMCFGPDVLVSRGKKTFMCQTLVYKWIYKMCWFSIFSIFFHTPQEMIRNWEPKKLLGGLHQQLVPGLQGPGRCWVACYGITFSNDCYDDLQAIPLKKKRCLPIYPENSPINSPWKFTSLEPLKITEFLKSGTSFWSTKPPWLGVQFQLWSFFAECFDRSR